MQLYCFFLALQSMFHHLNNDGGDDDGDVVYDDTEQFCVLDSDCYAVPPSPDK